MAKIACITASRRRRRLPTAFPAVAPLFWTAIMASACSSRLRNLAFSRLALANSAAKGFSAAGAGPRLRGVRALSTPVERWRRQSVSADEYRPSRRNRAAIPPGSVTRSASSRMRSFSLAEYVRRFGRGVRLFICLGWHDHEIVLLSPQGYSFGRKKSHSHWHGGAARPRGTPSVVTARLECINRPHSVCSRNRPSRSRPLLIALVNPIFSGLLRL